MITVEHTAQESSKSYPYVGVYYGTGANLGQVTYVKFLSPNFGFMIYSTRSGINEKNTYWEESFYRPMEGSLTINNEWRI